MNNLKYIFLIFALVVATACKTKKETILATEKKTTSVAKDPRLEQRITAIFIDANKEKILGNYRQAMTMYLQCLNLDPDHAPSMYELARLYRMQGNINDALGHAERAAELDQDNRWYNMMLASLYEQTGQFDKAIGIFEKLHDRYPDDVELMYQLAMLYLKENRLADAIGVYDKIERISGPDEDIIIQKKTLYLMMDQPDKAIAEIEKLIRMYPGESRFYALLAELYMDIENYPKAIETLKIIGELDPQNPYIHITLAEYYFKTGERNNAFEELLNGFANPELELDIKFQVLITYYSDEDIYDEFKDEVYQLSNILISTHPNDPRPYSLQADFLIRDENYEEARKAFRKVIEIDNSQYFMWETLLRLNAILLDTESMRDESLQAIELFPLQPIPYLFAGLAYFQLKEFVEAEKVLNRGKDLVVDDDELLAEFYMHLGDTYSKLEQHDASDAAFDQSLSLDPENPYVLNNYSYYLSLRKSRLDDAKRMSARSLELDPENKHYLDTYGWILYQMGDYEQARKWIEKSIDNTASEDPVVLEHLGDVLYKLGEKDSAIIYWKKALEMDGEATEFLERKVKDGTLYE